MLQMRIRQCSYVLSLGNREKSWHLLHCLRLQSRQLFFLEKSGDFEINARCETAIGAYALSVLVEQERHGREYQGEAAKKGPRPINA